MIWRQKQCDGLSLPLLLLTQGSSNENKRRGVERTVELISGVEHQMKRAAVTAELKPKRKDVVESTGGHPLGIRWL